MIYSKLKIFDWKRLHGYKPLPVYESMHLVYSSEIKLFTCCIVGHKSKKSAASQSFAVIFFLNLNESAYIRYGSCTSTWIRLINLTVPATQNINPFFPSKYTCACVVVMFPYMSCKFNQVLLIYKWNCLLHCACRRAFIVMRTET